MTLPDLHDLKRKRHVGGARHARQIAFHFRIQLQPVRVVFFLLLRGCRQIRNLAAFHHADAGRFRAGRTQRHDLTGLRRMALQVPVGRVHGLPDAVQIRLAVGGSRRFVGLVLRVRWREHGRRGKCGEQDMSKSISPGHVGDFDPTFGGCRCQMQPKRYPGPCFSRCFNRLRRTSFRIALDLNARRRDVRSVQTRQERSQPGEFDHLPHHDRHLPRRLLLRSPRLFRRIDPPAC